MTEPKTRLTSNKLLLFLGGAAALGLLLLSIHLLMGLASERTTLSCHKLKPTATQTEYCVYHTHTPGLLSNRDTVLIGPSPERGIKYTVPYERQNIKVEWDPATDAVTLVMPNTRLTISAETYVDTR